MSDSPAIDIGKLNKVIHSPIRLGVVAALHSGGEESFTNLKKAVGATDGNLTVHMRVLEEHGVVKVSKRFVGRRPRTSFTLTKKGMRIFREYIASMAAMVREHSKLLGPE